LKKQRGTVTGTSTLDDHDDRVNSGEIRWFATDATLFEDLAIDVGELTPWMLREYVAELRSECLFLRTAWRVACTRLQAEQRSTDALRQLLAPYRADIAAALKAESATREDRT